jgi:hypothetical protein
MEGDERSAIDRDKDEKGSNKSKNLFYREIQIIKLWKIIKDGMHMYKWIAVYKYQR